MLRIVVLNPKGGSGKTTVTTNLLATCASAGHRTALIDADRQGSAIRWLNQRSSVPAIHGVAAFEPQPAYVTRSFAMRVPPDTERVVVDTPAALDGKQLIDAVRHADKIVVPVLPSGTDMHAAARCIGTLLVQAKVPKGPRVLGVVANRVKHNTVMYAALMRFLDSLGLPVVAVLRDVQAYPRAAETGQGVCELRPHEAGAELGQWQGLLRWIDDDVVPEQTLTQRQPAQKSPERGHLTLIRR
jgi:chromosome partitioning protein